MNEVRLAPKEIKGKIGRLVNELKIGLLKLINDKIQSFEIAKKENDNYFFRTIASFPLNIFLRSKKNIFKLHPLTEVIDFTRNFFISKGFFETRAIEADEEDYVFKLLNIDEAHVASSES